MGASASNRRAEEHRREALLLWNIFGDSVCTFIVEYFRWFSTHFYCGIFLLVLYALLLRNIFGGSVCAFIVEYFCFNADQSKVLGAATFREVNGLAGIWYKTEGDALGWRLHPCPSQKDKVLFWML